MKRLIFIIQLFFMISNSLATEIDSFTQRYNTIDDSLKILNQKANRYFLRAVEIANGYNSCEKIRFFNIIRDQFGGLWWGQFESRIIDDDRIKKLHIERTYSIYMHFNFFDSFPLFLVNMGYLLKVGSFLIGTDKLGHFFEEGYIYFKMAYLQNRGLESAIIWGEDTEKGFYGGETTGVYSYADLAANYRGMTFWRNLVPGFYLGAKPYFTCSDGKWRMIREFDFSEYIDGSWDEGINCNRYRNKALLEKVQKRRSELEKKWNRRFQCPVDKLLQDKMVKSYLNVEFGQRLINLKENY